MSKSKYTYRLKPILTAIVVWEVIFWCFLYAALYLFGFIGNDEVTEHLAFKNPNVLWLNLLLIPMGIVYYVNGLRINKSVSKLSLRVQPYFFSPVSSFRSFFQFFLFRNAIVFLILTLAIPIYGSKKVVGTAESMELVIALDISNSMNTRDIDKQLSRLEIAKRALIQLVNNLHGERLGISIFAGDAFVQLPLTNDYYAAKMFINEIQTNMLSRQGTNIAQALKTSIEMFSELKTTKGIILVTDGENHEESPKEMVQQIVDKNIQLCVLGLGTMQGGLVPNHPDRPELGFKTDEQGQTIISKVNGLFIKKIASDAHGFSTVSDSPFPNLSALLTQINRMKRTKIEGIEFNVKETRYQIPLVLALVFWILYLIGMNNLSKMVHIKK